MAEKQQHKDRGVALEHDQLCCSVCLDFLIEPVTIACGHSYCRSCIESYWDQKKEKGPCICPQCRKTYDPRPVLGTNIMLAELVEKLQKMSPQQAPVSAPLSASLTSARPGDVSCDFCLGTKPNKATMSCLTCLASYCPAHLEPHHRIPVLKTHQLVSAIVPLQDKMCKKHNKLMELYCETDKQLVCSLCSVKEHSSHTTVPASVQKVKTMSNLALRQKEVQDRAHLGEKKQQELRKMEKNVKSCAEAALKDCDRIFEEMISSIQNERSLVKKLIKAQLKGAEDESERIQQQLEEDVTKLRGRGVALEQLSHVDDHIYLIQAFQSLSAPCDTRDPSQWTGPQRSFTDVTDCVSELRNNVNKVLKETWPRLLATASYVDFSLPPAPNTREEFLRYCCPLTLDKTTNYPYLHPLNDNLRVRPTASPYSAKPDRFTKFRQVLCEQSLSERCYWEVEWCARTLSAAVAYRDISRASDDSRFGNNDKSWSLECTASGYSFRHNNIETTVQGSCSNKIGVYLDYRAGILCFYHVSDPMVLLHKVQTTFTRPLYPGLGLNYAWYDVGVFAQLAKLW